VGPINTILYYIFTTDYLVVTVVVNMESPCPSSLINSTGPFVSIVKHHLRLLEIYTKRHTRTHIEKERRIEVVKRKITDGKYRSGESEWASLTPCSAKVYRQLRGKVQNIKRPFYGFRAHLAAWIVAATVGRGIYFIILYVCLLAVTLWAATVSAA